VDIHGDDVHTSHHRVTNMSSSCQGLSQFGIGIDQLKYAPILQRELELIYFEQNGLDSDFDMNEKELSI